MDATCTDTGIDDSQRAKRVDTGHQVDDDRLTKGRLSYQAGKDVVKWARKARARIRSKPRGGWRWW